MNGIPKGYEVVPEEEIPSGYEVVPPAEESRTAGPIYGSDLPLMELTQEEGARNIRHAAQLPAGAMYPIPYVGPALAGAGATVLGRGADYLQGVQPEEPFVEEMAKNVAGAYVFKGAEKLLGAGARAVAPYLKPLEGRIASVVRRGIQKGIRPTVAGKGTAAQTETYFKKAQAAVESIIENKASLKYIDEAKGEVIGELPKSLNEFSQAIGQTKKTIFDRYDKILREAGDDIKLPLDDIVDELNKFSGGKVNKLFRSKAKGYSDELAELYSGQSLTLTEAQEAISILNEDLNVFYRNPTHETATKAAIDAMVANRLRSLVDSAVEGSGYQALKNQYGALRTIEKEVNHRAIVDARKNIKGLIDFADIASAAEAAKAIASLDPAHGSAAVAIKAMKSLYKHVNNPNVIIKNMFKDTEKLISRRYLPTP